MSITTFATEKALIMRTKYNSSENYKHTANYIVPRHQEELSWHLNEFF